MTEPLLTDAEMEKFKERFPEELNRTLATDFDITERQAQSLGYNHGLTKNRRYMSKQETFGEWFSQDIVSPPADEVSYLAGFFDGEGTFTVNRIERKSGRKKGNIEFRPLIHVSNTNEKIIDWIRKLIGGTKTEEVKTPKNHKILYRCRTSSIPKISSLCELLIPHLKVKKKVAKLLKRWCDSRMDNSQEFERDEKGQFSNQVEGSYSEEEKRIYRKIKNLNERGDRSV